MIKVKPTIKNILILFLGLGPIFWFGPIEPHIFKYIKFFIFFLLLILLFLDKTLKNDLKHSNTIILFIVLALIFSIPGFIQSDISAIFFMLRSYILIALVSWIFYSYFKNKEFDEIIDVFFKASRIIGLISIFIVLNHFFNFVDWKHISEGTRKYAHLVKLADTGFTTGRTVWAHSLAYYFAVALYAAFYYKKKMYLIFAASIFATQVLSGGRGGMLISLLILATYIISKINLKWVVIITVSIVLVAYYNKDYLIKRLRIDRLENTGGSALNKFTAGRFSQYEFAVSKIASDYNFIKGNGFLKEDSKGQTHSGKKADIHVVWLKKFLEGGVLYLLIHLVFTFLFFIRIVNLVRKDKKYAVFLHVFLGGIITTMFEPNAVFGVIQSYFIWWAVIAAVEAIRIRIKNDKMLKTQQI